MGQPRGPACAMSVLRRETRPTHADPVAERQAGAGRGCAMERAAVSRKPNIGIRAEGKPVGRGGFRLGASRVGAPLWLALGLDRLARSLDPQYAPHRLQSGRPSAGRRAPASGHGDARAPAAPACGGAAGHAAHRGAAAAAGAGGAAAVRTGNRDRAARADLLQPAVPLVRRPVPGPADLDAAGIWIFPGACWPAPSLWPSWRNCCSARRWRRSRRLPAYR